MVVVVAHLVDVFEDAAYFYAGQGKDLATELLLFAILGFGLGNQEVFRFPNQRYHRSIGMNRASLDVSDLCDCRAYREFQRWPDPCPFPSAP